MESFLRWGLCCKVVEGGRKAVFRAWSVEWMNVCGLILGKIQVGRRNKDRRGAFWVLYILLAQSGDLDL